MYTRLLTISILALTLAGCASAPHKAVSVKPTTPPAKLMTPCADLPQFKSDSSDTSDLVGYNISLIQAYGHCSLKLKKLQAWVQANS